MLTVMKFGGSCLKTKEDIDRVARIVASGKEKTVLVVSALYGVTDSLVECLDGMGAGGCAVPAAIAEFRERHEKIAWEAIPDRKILRETIEIIGDRIQKMERLLHGVSYTEELTERTRAFILSFGERLAVTILDGALRSRGIKSHALEADKIGIVTDESFGSATAIMPLVRINLKKNVSPLLAKGTVPIITGYFGCTEDGRITTFGMNGSDYSAAVIASALGAGALEIWKDVPGFMTADPRFVKGARLVRQLSYYESAELSYFGAKILHPRTIEPLLEEDIPIYIRNIYTPADAGTRISRAARISRGLAVKSVTFSTELAVLKIQGAGVGYKPGIIGELGRTLSEHGINIYSVITSQTCINILIGKADLERAHRSVRKLAGGVIEKIAPVSDIALIAVVGEGLLRTRGLAARVFTAVARQNVNVEMISAGASETAYYFIVNKKDLGKTINAVHREFFGEK